MYYTTSVFVALPSRTYTLRSHHHPILLTAGVVDSKKNLKEREQSRKRKTKINKLTKEKMQIFEDIEMGF